MMQLSFRSRTTSISNSFQPISDSSINSSEMGDSSSPRRQMAWNCSASQAMPAPLPPMVNEGRTMTGNPSESSAAQASAMVWATPERAGLSPIPAMACLNFDRSSALSMASAEAPINSTP